MYETKVLLIAIGHILRKSDSVEDAYRTLAKMANAEGVLLEPFEEGNTEKANSKERAL